MYAVAPRAGTSGPEWIPAGSGAVAVVFSASKNAVVQGR
jgi:hypothetical protein